MTDKAMNQQAIEQLIIGHFDGSLSEEQEKELAEVLATSTASKQLFLSYMRMEGRLHSLGRDGFLREPTAEPQEIVHQPTDVSGDPIHHGEDFFKNVANEIGGGDSKIFRKLSDVFCELFRDSCVENTLFAFAMAMTIAMTTATMAPVLT